MQGNIKVLHVLGWSIKKLWLFEICSSSFQIRGCMLLFQQLNVFQYSACRRQNHLLVLVEELVKLFCSNYFQNSQITAAVHYFQKQPLEVFCKKVVFKKFANFIRQQLRWSQLLRACNLAGNSNSGAFLWNLRNLKK